MEVGCFKGFSMTSNIFLLELSWGGSVVQNWISALSNENLDANIKAALGLIFTNINIPHRLVLEEISGVFLFGFFFFALFSEFQLIYDSVL